MQTQPRPVKVDEAERYVDEFYVAEMTGLSVKTLRNHRSKKVGIPYHKVGRQVRYFIPDVHAYCKQQLRRTTKRGRGRARAKKRMGE